MGWIFRKRFRNGPVTTIVSKKGLGFSWGISGFRIGFAPDGRKFVSLGIPGTGFYFIKYLSGSKQDIGTSKQVLDTGQIDSQVDENKHWWNQKYFKDQK